MAEALVIELPAMEKAKKEIREATEAVSRFDRTAERMQKKLASWLQEKHELVLEISDRITPELERIEIRMEAVLEKSWKAAAGGFIRQSAPIFVPDAMSSRQLRYNSEQWQRNSTMESFYSRAEAEEKRWFESHSPGAGEKAGMVSTAGTQPEVMDSILSFIQTATGVMSVWGSASTASGQLEGQGIMGGLARLGKLLGSKSSSGGGLAFGGAAAIAGVVEAGNAVVKGGKALIQAVSSGNKEERQAYFGSGINRIGWTGIGTAIGTAILPGLGTVIGSGMGALIGNITGDAMEQEYEKKANAIRISMEQAKYSSQELKNAIADTNMTAEQFGALFQKVVTDDMKAHFGNIQLSLSEIRSTARKITFGDSIREIKKFAEAASQVQESLNALQSSSSALDKWNWEAGQGKTYSDEEQKEFKGVVKSFGNHANQYIENSQYETDNAMDVLFGETGSDIYKKNTEKLYNTYKEDIKQKVKSLNSTTENAFQDGKLKGGKLKLIEEKQKEIEEYTSNITELPIDVKYDILGRKNGGKGKISQESFLQIQTEGKNYLDEFIGYQDQIFNQVALALAKEKEKKIIDGDKYKDQLGAAAEAYRENIKAASGSFEEYQIGVIADAYKDELNGIVPGRGSLGERLKSIVDEAGAKGIEGDKWDRLLPDMLHITSLKKEKKTEILSLLKLVEEAIPDSVKQQERSKYANPDLIMFEQGRYGFVDDEGMINITLRTIPAASGGNERISAAEGGSETSSYSSSSGGFGEKTVSDIAEGMGRSFPELETMAQRAWDVTNSALMKAYSNPFTVRQDINLDFNYHYNRLPGQEGFMPFPVFKPASASDNGNTGSKPGQGSDRETIGPTPEAHARGGFITNRRLSWVGEEGPEAIIPLVPGRRSRGIALWEKTGRLLGIAGKLSAAGDTDAFPGMPEGAGEPFITPPGEAAKAGAVSIRVDVQASPAITISGGGDENRILSAIRAHMGEMAEELGSEIAGRLNQAFSNRPLKEA